jgi:hypothetical protein
MHEEKKVRDKHTDKDHFDVNSEELREAEFFFNNPDMREDQPQMID